MCFFLSETGGAEEGNKSKGFASQQGSFLCSAQRAVPGAGVSTWGQRAAPLQPLDEAGVAVAEPPAHPGPRGIEVSLQSAAHFLWVSNQSEKKKIAVPSHLKNIFLTKVWVSLTQVAFWEGLSQPERMV